MFNTVDSVPRQDVSTALMEAVGQDKQFIAQMLMPIYPSATEVGRYPRFRKQAAELLRGGRNPNSDGTFNSSTRRGGTGTYNEVTRKFEWDSYQTSEFGLEERVDDVIRRRMTNFFDCDMITAKLLMNELMLDYEMEVAAKLNTTTSSDSAEGFVSTNSTVAYTEANTAGATPFDFPTDLTNCIERLTLLGTNPDELSLVLSLSAYNRIRRSNKLQTYVYGFLNVTQGGSQISEQMIASAFGIRGVLVAKKSVDVAVKGKTPNLVPVWGNTNAMLLKTGEGDFMNGGAGRSIIWDADSPGGLFTSEQYRDEKRRGDMLRVRSNRVLKIIDPTCAQLINLQWS